MLAAPVCGTWPTHLARQFESEDAALQPEVKPHPKMKTFVIYRQMEVAGVHSMQLMVMLRAKLHTSLEELASTEDQRAYMIQHSFFDSAVLQVEEKATAEDPFQFLGVRWLACHLVFSCHTIRWVVELSKSMKGTQALNGLVKGQKIKSMADGVDCVATLDIHGPPRVCGCRSSAALTGERYRGRADGVEDRSHGNRSTSKWFASRVVPTLHNMVIHRHRPPDAEFLVRRYIIAGKAWGLQRSTGMIGLLQELQSAEVSPPLPRVC